MRGAIGAGLSIVVVVFLFSQTVVTQDLLPIVVRTRSGLVRGEISGPVRSFRGIPFAAPPVGDLRWRPPARAVSWNDVRDATAFGEMCIQIDANGVLRGSEDCLTLNVFTASAAPVNNQPVMIFFHGGGNKRGSAQQPWFDHPPLATKGVVVVTADYRLGVLGFFAHPLLTAEGGGSSGNYGLMDQIAALRWVRDNIKSFGGDPDRVMVFGQSSGSYDIQGLLTSPAAHGLFSRAGMESGSIPSGQSLSLNEMEAAGAPFVSGVQCDNAQDALSCLRAVPAQDIVQNQAGIPFLLTVEPRVMPRDPFDVLERNGSPVPLLIGSNREETASSDDAAIALDVESYRTTIRTEFAPFGPGVADTVLELYPASAYDSPRYALIAVHSDFNVTAEVRAIARAAAIGHAQPVWRYLFTHRFENDPDLNTLRAFHMAELFFVFGNLDNILGTPYAPAQGEIALSNRIMRYWTQFAAYGNPNGPGPVEWRRYPGESETILELDESPRVLQGYHIRQCNFLSSLQPQP